MEIIYSFGKKKRREDEARLLVCSGFFQIDGRTRELAIRHPEENHERLRGAAGILQE